MVNATWIIGCKIIQVVLGMVISALTVRHLGPSNFGVINYAAAIVSFIVPVVKLGLPHVLVQEIVCCPESEGEALGSSLVMSLISSAFCVVGVVSFVAITDSGNAETILVCALYSLLLVANAFELIQYWFQAKLISKYTSVVSVIGYFLISIYKIILIVNKQSVYWFAVSNAIDHLIIGIVLIIIYQKKSNHKLRFSWQYSKKLFGKSKFFIVSSMMVAIFVQTDKIMLKFMMGTAETGIYSAASECAVMASFVFVAIIDSLRPTIVEHKKNNSPLYEKRMCLLYSIIIYMALTQCILMTVCAKPIISILYGHDFMESTGILTIVVWQTMFSYMGSVRNVWILAEEKQRYLWVINLSGILTNVILNFTLIPIWGGGGAAIASVMTQMLTNFVLGFILKPIRRSNYLMIQSINPKFILDALRKKALGNSAHMDTGRGGEDV